MLKTISVFILLVALISCGGDKESLTREQANIEYDIILKGGKKNISYINQARPVLEKRCIVCHGCYDAPCQLKLTSIDGIQRGANKNKVYNGERFSAAEPTRMFIDANSTEEWRKKNFHSVLNEQQENGIDNLRHSVLYKMLRLKQLNPQPRVGMIDKSIDLSLGREQSCPTDKNFAKYSKEFPNQGMPFAMPNLSDSDYHVLVKWISQGLPDDSKKSLPDSSRQQRQKWESFLNKQDMKHRLLSRYLYEHLFLGHLYFKGANTREFFRLVRSYTAPGEAIKDIPTVRVYDDPGVESFYYRLRYVKSSIVDKTHSIYELSDKRMARYKELFITPDYKVSQLPSYKPEVASNPIKAFIELPAKSRYLFLLDDAKFFIEGFIKGPVCRGQVALNVIEDNFWLFFSSPDKFKVNTDENFLAAVSDLLNMPAESGSSLDILAIYTNYKERHNKYIEARSRTFEAMDKISLDQSMEYIWDGSDSMNQKNAALSIFRHFDSATVQQGLIGDYPESAWVLDYPMLERIHYLLVAGYNVYGNLVHQFNTRLYMDFLRIEGENIFLAWMPVEQRKKIHDSWYTGIRGNDTRHLRQPEDWLAKEFVYGYTT
ncbi:Fatty acid cis/trans isomerase, partial [hydrothermal vent metagenome]